MAFCNKCGATLNADAKFCDKCGAPLSVTPAATGQPAPPRSQGGGGALKIVLLVVGVIILLGIIGIAALTVIGIHIAKNAHVSQNGQHVKVDTPFGGVEATKDPEQAVRDMGVEVYPGAEVESDGAASTTVGNMHTVTANFDTSDPAEKVCAFYKSKFPNATVSTSNQNQCTIVSKDNKNMVTINVESSGDGTKLHIASVTR